MSELTYNKTIEDVAVMFNVNPETVRRWCRDGKIKFIKLPGDSGKGEYRFSESDLKIFIDESGVDGGAQDSQKSS
ncbi:MAG: helix-turn-helix domain-containing protein [Candidatus Woesebacteria bacterium]|jgi:excisionase family DNA binding protein